jgi:Tfp pilus assembly protein PilE
VYRLTAQRQIAGEAAALNLLVIFILAVLVTAFALPAYRSYTLREHNKLARIALQDVIERYHAWQKQHPDQRPQALADLGIYSNSLYVSSNGTTDSSANINSIYRVSLAPPDSPSAQTCGLQDTGQAGMILVADPVQTQRVDTQCARLCLSSSGQKGVSGTAGVAQCWGSR